MPVYLCPCHVNEKYSLIFATDGDQEYICQISGYIPNWVDLILQKYYITSAAIGATTQLSLQLNIVVNKVFRGLRQAIEKRYDMDYHPTLGNSLVVVPTSTILTVAALCLIHYFGLK